MSIHNQDSGGELRTCTIPGCAKRRVAQGLCNAHYKRMRRHGDPRGGRTAIGDPARFIREIVLLHGGDECLFWPYNRGSNGYGIITRQGKSTGAHRLVCELAHGPAQTPLHEAAHTCGKGHLGCVAPNHLQWKTRKENHADKVVHGTHNRGARNPNSLLTDSAVKRIRGLRDVVPGRVLARQYNVSPATICNIQKRVTWGWL
jgi:hypothetical protein